MRKIVTVKKMLHHRRRATTVIHTSGGGEDSPSGQILHELAAATGEKMPSLIPQNDNAGGTESPVLRAKLPTRKRVTKRKAETDVIEDSDIHATKRRSSSRDAEGNGQNHEELGSHEANGPAKTTATNGQKVAKKHKKFIDGEDEEPLVSTALANGNLIEKPKPQQPEVNSDSDDDEAPEAITAAAGLESSRLLTAQAARISKKYVFP